MKNIFNDPTAQLLPEDHGKRCLYALRGTPLSPGIILCSNEYKPIFYLGQDEHNGSVFISSINPFKHTYSVGNGSIRALRTNNVDFLIILEPEEEASLYSQPIPTKQLRPYEIVKDDTGAEWATTLTYFPIYVLINRANPEINTGIVTAAWLNNHGFSNLFKVK